MDQHHGDNFYREIMCSSLSLQQSGKIANSRQLEMRPGKDEVTVPFEQRESMRPFRQFLTNRPTKPNGQESPLMTELSIPPACAAPT